MNDPLSTRATGRPGGTGIDVASTNTDQSSGPDSGDAPHWLDEHIDVEAPSDRFEAYERDFEARALDREAHRRAHRRVRAAARPRRAPVHDRAEIVAGLTDLDDTLASGFGERTTYIPGELERAWLLPAVGPFFVSGLITDITRMVKGGKEACVYQCAAAPGLGVAFVAAKVYRPRRFRNLRNDARYREGRQMLDADGKALRGQREDRAIRKGTRAGKAMKHASWLAHEYKTLERLRDAGADVPEPIAMGDNCIIMDFVGDEHRAAPTLSDTRIRRTEAPALLEQIVRNIEIMLSLQLVHGDLSAYNILYWQGEPTLIDFPQAVDAYENPAARELFGRDVIRVCEHLARRGASVDGAALAERLWSRHVRADPWSRPRPGHEETMDVDTW